MPCYTGAPSWNCGRIGHCVPYLTTWVNWPWWSTKWSISSKLQCSGQQYGNIGPNAGPDTVQADHRGKFNSNLLQFERQRKGQHLQDSTAHLPDVQTSINLPTPKWLLTIASHFSMAIDSLVVMVCLWSNSTILAEI